ncbi:anacyclamide/piricyclamide family prenylated cyclic peptide [Kamptonema formosum]|nr:anacyclamide/piricyclamide family prenylated cyclic peptide [Oscillatoria sp. PCC 10802]
METKKNLKPQVSAPVERKITGKNSIINNAQDGGAVEASFLII